MTHGSQIPKVVYDYFSSVDQHGYRIHPIVVGEFMDRWQRTNFKKRITVSWARKLKNLGGVTWVTLSDGTKEADFRVDEIIKGGYQ